MGHEQANAGAHNPRLTEEYLESRIEQELYHVFPDTALTVCALILDNGYAVVGESAPITVANFNEARGREIARARARDKMWSLYGFVARERRHRQQSTGLPARLSGRRVGNYVDRQAPRGS